MPVPGDHHVLRSLHENYLNFLSGKDDSGDEERRRDVCSLLVSEGRSQLVQAADDLHAAPGSPTVRNPTAREPAGGNAAAASGLG